MLSSQCLSESAKSYGFPAGDRGNLDADVLSSSRQHSISDTSQNSGITTTAISLGSAASRHAEIAEIAALAGLQTKEVPGLALRLEGTIRKAEELRYTVAELAFKGGVQNVMLSAK